MTTLWEAFTAAAGPWSVRNGRASVDLIAGNASFEVEGLVLNGGSASGTPGPVSAVVGTLVCNAGTQTQVILDTTVVPLNVHGDAYFSGRLQNIPVTCVNPSKDFITAGTNASCPNGDAIDCLLLMAELFARVQAEHPSSFGSSGMELTLPKLDRSVTARSHLSSPILTSLCGTHS